MPSLVAGDQSHCAVPVPGRECVGLGVRLRVRRGMQLEHDVAGRHDQRVRRVHRLLEVDAPLLCTLVGQARKRRQPVGLVLPHVRERLRNPHLARLRPP